MHYFYISFFFGVGGQGTPPMQLEVTLNFAQLVPSPEKRRRGYPFTLLRCCNTLTVWSYGFVPIVLMVLSPSVSSTTKIFSDLNSAASQEQRSSQTIGLDGAFMKIRICRVRIFFFSFLVYYSNAELLIFPWLSQDALTFSGRQKIIKPFQVSQDLIKLTRQLQSWSILATYR